MSSGKMNPQGGNAAAASSLPTRFRCKVGLEWKPLSEFSNAQRKLIQRGLDGHSRIDAANSGMTCREHSASSRTEMCCDLCELTKPISEFSKSSRQAGDVICRRCSAWNEVQEPQVTPTPLETGHISVEEDKGEVWQKCYVASNDFFSGSFSQAPVTEMASLGLNGQAIGQQQSTKIDAALVENASANLSDSVSGHGLSSVELSEGSWSDVSSVSEGPTETSSLHSLPPHLKGKVKGWDRSQASHEDFDSSIYGHNAYEGPRDAFFPGEPNVWGTAPTRQYPPHLFNRFPTRASSVNSTELSTTSPHELIPYNAWSPEGMLHAGVKSITVPSSTDAESIASQEQEGKQQKTNFPKRNTGGSKFAKPPRLSRNDAQDPEPFNSLPVRRVCRDRDEKLLAKCCNDSDEPAL